MIICPFGTSNDVFSSNFLLKLCSALKEFLYIYKKYIAMIYNPDEMGLPVQTIIFGPGASNGINDSINENINNVINGTVSGTPSISEAQAQLTAGWFSPEMAEGTPMEGMTNPYISGIDWQSVLDYLGGASQLFSKKGTRNYELYLKALEWNNNMMSQLASWDAERMIYEQQVQGQREAGLNPDLNGVSGNSSGFSGPGSPSGESSVAGTTSDSGSQTVGFIFNVVSSVVSVFNAAAGAAMKGAQITGQKLMNEGQKTLNDIRRGERVSTELDTILDYFANTISEGNMTDFLDGKTGALALSMDAGKFASYTGLSLEQAERLTRGWNERITSPEVASVLSQRIADRYKSLGELKDTKSRPGFKDDFDANSLLRHQYSLLMLADNMIAEMKAVKANYDKIYYNALSPQQQAAFQNSKNIFDTSYYRALDPKTSAAAANAEKALGFVRSKFENNVYNLVNSIMSDPNATQSDLTFATQVYAQLIQARSYTLSEFGASWISGSQKGVVDFLETPIMNLFNGQGIQGNEMIFGE